MRVLTARLRVRNRRWEFHPDVPQRVLDLHPTLFVVWRGRPAGKGLLAVHNVSGETQRLRSVPGSLLEAGEGVHREGARLELPPCGFAWLTDVLLDDAGQVAPEPV